MKSGDRRMTEGQRERIWRKRYENSVNFRDEIYEEINRASPVSTYDNVNSEDVYDAIKDFTFKSYERLDDSWIRI